MYDLSGSNDILIMLIMRGKNLTIVHLSFIQGIPKLPLFQDIYRKIITRYPKCREIWLSPLSPLPPQCCFATRNQSRWSRRKESHKNDVCSPMNIEKRDRGRLIVQGGWYSVNCRAITISLLLHCQPFVRHIS